MFPTAPKRPPWPGHVAVCEAVDDQGTVVFRWRSFLWAFEDMQERAGWDRERFVEALEHGIIRRCPDGVFIPPTEPDTRPMQTYFWDSEETRLARNAKLKEMCAARWKAWRDDGEVGPSPNGGEHRKDARAKK
jgi:hypothetical protein